MKRFATILFSLIIIFSFSACGSTEYTFKLPEKEKITKVEMTKGSYKSSFATELYIEDFTEIFEDTQMYTTVKSTKSEPEVDLANSDAPIKIDVYTDDEQLTFFVYDKNKKRYLEQPHNGIYEISQEIFSDVNRIYANRRVDLHPTVKEKLISLAEMLKPFDDYGKNFETIRLSDEELLRYGFIIAASNEADFKEITFKHLNEKYIIDILGVTEAVPEDITCSCGQVIAQYNSENDLFTPDDSLHYKQHLVNSFNGILDVYRTDDKYIVEMLKVFGDTDDNSSVGEYNFYPTYKDSKEQTNKIDSIPDPQYPPEEYIPYMNMYNMGFYKLTFTNEEPYTLVSYEIVDNFGNITDGSGKDRHSSNPFRLLFNKLWEWVYE